MRWTFRETLTRAVRGRPSLFLGHLIMQVEVRVEKALIEQITAYLPPPDCPNEDEWKQSQADRIAAAWSFYKLDWRDATWEDQLDLLQVTSTTALSTLPLGTRP